MVSDELATTVFAARSGKGCMFSGKALPGRYLIKKFSKGKDFDMVGKDDKDGQIALLRKALDDVAEALRGRWHDDVRAENLCEDCGDSLNGDRYVAAGHLDEIRAVAEGALAETTY